MKYLPVLASSNCKVREETGSVCDLFGFSTRERKEMTSRGCSFSVFAVVAREGEREALLLMRREELF